MSKKTPKEESKKHEAGCSALNIHCSMLKRKLQCTKSPLQPAPPLFQARYSGQKALYSMPPKTLVTKCALQPPFHPLQHPRTWMIDFKEKMS